MNKYYYVCIIQIFILCLSGCISIDEDDKEYSIRFYIENMSIEDRYANISITIDSITIYNDTISSFHEIWTFIGEFNLLNGKHFIELIEFDIGIYHNETITINKEIQIKVGYQYKNNTPDLYIVSYDKDFEPY